MEYFFPWYIFTTNSHRFVAKSVQLSMAFQAFYAAGRLGHVLWFLYNYNIYRNLCNTCHDWKKKKTMTAWKRKKRMLGFGSKQLSFSRFRCFPLRMDKFLVKPKKKPCSITPQEWANQYPGKFHADGNLLFCSTCNVVVDHHRKSVLDNHKFLDDLVVRLGWQKLNLQHELKTATMVYKSLNGLTPDYLKSMFTDRSATSTYSLRNCEGKLTLLLPCTNFLKK